MKRMPTTYRRLTGVAVALLVLAPAGAALAAARPAGMPPTEYRAAVIRGQALNEKYGLGVPHGMTAAQYRAELIRGQALNERYGLGVPHGMTAAQYRAELIRGQALNEKYGLGVPHGMTAAQYRAMLIRGRAMNDLYVNQRYVPPATPVVTTTGGFDWTDASIGAAVALGVVLLGGALVATARHGGRWHPHAPVS